MWAFFWQCHYDGISQPAELESLSRHGLQSVELDYSISKQTDPYGNVLRWWSKVQRAAPLSDVVAMDVIFVRAD